MQGTRALLLVLVLTIGMSTAEEDGDDTAACIGNGVSCDPDSKCCGTDQCDITTDPSRMGTSCCTKVDPTRPRSDLSDDETPADAPADAPVHSRIIMCKAPKPT